MYVHEFGFSLGNRVVIWESAAHSVYSTNCACTLSICIHVFTNSARWLMISHLFVHLYFRSGFGCGLFKS